MSSGNGELKYFDHHFYFSAQLMGLYTLSGHLGRGNDEPGTPPPSVTAFVIIAPNFQYFPLLAAIPCETKKAGAMGRHL